MFAGFPEKRDADPVLIQRCTAVCNAIVHHYANNGSTYRVTFAGLTKKHEIDITSLSVITSNNEMYTVSLMWRAKPRGSICLPFE